ncbi:MULTISPECIES: hypothetical protein [Streptomyces]|uniref:hypothetical protein n=1 Tax=Streptomyces TaxID=1883 RepID=UPI0033CDBDF8
MRTVHVGAALLLSVALLTSCSPSESSGGEQAADSEERAGKPTAVTTISLPLDPYQVSDSDFGKASRALAVLTDQCMEQQGFDYEAPEQQSASATPTGHERRYGITDLGAARKYGYHLGGAPTPQQQPRESKRYERALAGTGKPRGSSGEFDDGCTGEAHKELEAGIDMEAVDLPQWYKRDSFQRSMRDSRVTTAFREWSGCMAGKGHRFSSPLDPPGSRKVMGRKVTAYERSVAVADIECKGRTGLVVTWRDVESALQKATVTSRAKELEKARTETAKLVRRADKILASEDG